MSSVPETTPDDCPLQPSLIPIYSVKGRVKELVKQRSSFLLFLYSEEEKAARWQEYANFADIFAPAITQDISKDPGNIALTAVSSTADLKSTISYFLTCFTNLKSVCTLYIVFNFHGTSDGSLVLKTFKHDRCVAVTVDEILLFIEEHGKSLCETNAGSRVFYFPELVLVFPQCNSHCFDKATACSYKSISEVIWFTSEDRDFTVSLEQGRHGRVHTSLMSLATNPCSQQSLRMWSKDETIEKLKKELAHRDRQLGHDQRGIEEARDMAEDSDQKRLHEDISREYEIWSRPGKPQVAVSPNFFCALMAFIQKGTKKLPGDLQAPKSEWPAIDVLQIKFLPEKCCDRFSHPDRRSNYLRLQPDGTLANDRGHVYCCASLYTSPRNPQCQPNLVGDFFLLGHLTLEDALFSAIKLVPLELSDSNRESLDLSMTVREWFTSGVGQHIYVVPEV